MNKIDYIQQEWEKLGYDWDEIKDTVDSQGWAILPELTEKIVKLMGSFEFSIKTYPESTKVAVQPSTCRDVDHNAGWKKIEWPTDLPREEGLYVVFYNNQQILRRYSLSYQDIWLKEFTHWRRPYPNPLY